MYKSYQKLVHQSGILTKVDAMLTKLKIVFYIISVEKRLM